jgi:hypothetical protein
MLTNPQLKPGFDLTIRAASGYNTVSDTEQTYKELK